MTQKPPALFVPNVYALGHLGHVVYVDPNDPKTTPLAASSLEGNPRAFGHDPNDPSAPGC
jgi:hypothetical protein